MASFRRTKELRYALNKDMLESNNIIIAITTIKLIIRPDLSAILTRLTYLNPFYR